MITRFYVHNYRCFENFTIDFADRPSVLVIGKNGSGKSTLRQALGVFQSICRGDTRIRDVVTESDFAQQRKHIPIRFEVELTLHKKRFQYSISFEKSENLREMVIGEERLSVDGSEFFKRQQDVITLPELVTKFVNARFDIGHGAPALLFIRNDSIEQLRSFFVSMVLIAPIPANMSGFSEEETVELQHDASNFSSWLKALLLRYPAAYTHLDSYLKSVMPDLQSFENVLRGEKGTQLLIKFEQKSSDRVLAIDFKHLSDGEKCFFLSALIVASNKVKGPVFCLWDEPDNHLSLPEVSHFIMQLRKMTNQGGQFIATSHHPQTIRTFGDDTTLVFTRKSHLEPTVVRTLSELKYNGDLIEALIRDEVIG